MHLQLIWCAAADGCWLLTAKNELKNLHIDADQSNHTPRRVSTTIRIHNRQSKGIINAPTADLTCCSWRLLTFNRQNWVEKVSYGWWAVQWYPSSSLDYAQFITVSQQAIINAPTANLTCCSWQWLTSNCQNWVEKVAYGCWAVQSYPSSSFDYDQTS